MSVIVRREGFMQGPVEVDGLSAVPVPGAALAGALDGAPGPVVVFDDRLRCLHCNPHAARLFGVRDAAGRPATLLLADWPLLQLACSDVLERGEPVVGLDIEAASAQPADGRSWIASVQPLRAAGGALCGVAAYLAERAPVGSREIELERELDASRRASAAKDRFLAMLSHELRTPLNPVLLAVQSLRRDATLSPAVHDVLESVHRNLRLTVGLVDDLLDLNRIAYGKVELRRTSVDLHELILHAGRICEHEARARDVKVDLRLDATDSRIDADAMRIEQVLWNLLRNGIKFSPPGGRVEIASRSEPGCVVLEMSDQGIGIDAQTLPTLFHAFEQGNLPQAYRSTGLGLGLALARSLVELHEGTLGVRSAGTGCGATFELRLPLADATPTAPGNERQCRAADALSPAILLVEDHEDSASMLAAMLGMNGWLVSVADSMAGAVELARRQRFDLLVSDLSLPDGSGLDLLRSLQALRNPAESPLKAIALSGFGTPADIERSLQAGYSAHLVKPLDVDALLDAICDAFNADASG